LAELPKLECFGLRFAHCGRGKVMNAESDFLRMQAVLADVIARSFAEPVIGRAFAPPGGAGPLARNDE
jgi:hypothetical protein